MLIFLPIQRLTSKLRGKPWTTDENMVERPCPLTFSQFRTGFLYAGVLFYFEVGGISLWEQF